MYMSCTALQLGKAAVVSGSVFVIFKVVKTITPMPVSKPRRLLGMNDAGLTLSCRVCLQRWAVLASWLVEAAGVFTCCAR